MRGRLLFARAKKIEEDTRKGDVFGMNEKKLGRGEETPRS